MLLLNKKQKEQLKKLAKNYGLDFLVLFGSQALGKTHQESDYDIGYLSKNKLSVEKEGALILDLALLLNIPLEKIELVYLRGISPLFLKEIFDKAKVLFERDPVIIDEYKIFSQRYFEEFKPLLREMNKILKKKVERYKEELKMR
jgi:predicted nucleotidyltransferase